MSKILVTFNCQIGDYESNSYYIFDKKKSDWGYCKHFWGLTKKNKLSDDVFWDDQMMNAISVSSCKNITEQEEKNLRELGIV